MINRTLVRTRVIQTMFAYCQDPEKTPSSAKKDLLKGFADTYSLYMQLLELINEITRYAEQQIEENIQRAKVTHRTYMPNRRFVDNRFAKQLFENRTLRHYVTEENLGWDYGMNAVVSLYKEITASSIYRQYMTDETDSYANDRRLWRKIFELFVPANEELPSALDEMEVQTDRQNWNTDLETVSSYVVKTIRAFHEDSTPDQPLLEMFDTEEELNFGVQLLEHAIEKRQQYDELISRHLRNWDVKRLAYMDQIILYVALAEILNFPEIALEVSLNEYLELAKEYSSEKSHIFINGLLDVILKSLNEDDALVKQVR